MKNKKITIIVVGILTLSIIGYALISQSNSHQPVEQLSNVQQTNPELSKRYIDYSPDNLAKVTKNNERAILFFAAFSWCPTCQAADRDFKAHFDKIPSDIAILKVNYDHDTGMKQKYGIIIQDTFVQVDKNGKEITRWNSGGQGIQALLIYIK